MKFAFSTNAYRNYSLSDSLKSIASVGYSGAEIMCDEPHAFPPISDEKISSIKNLLLKNNLEISNLNGFMLCAIEDFHHPSWIEPLQPYRQKRIEHTKNCIELAKKLGAKSVSTEPGGPLNSLSENVNLDLFEDGINEVLSVAEKNKIHLLIEPEPGLLIEDSNQFLNFIERFNSKYLGLNFDIGHFFCVNEDPEILIKNLKDFIYHIHLEDITKNRIHKHLIPGEGAINFQKIFESILEINYQGFVTVELYPYLDNPEKAAKNALNFIKKIIHND